jgi:hypothetical protein
MLTAPEVMPLVLQACPSFSTVWSSLQHDDLHVDEDGNRLHYADAAEVARHLVARFQAGAWDELRACFHVIERLHLEGDPYVRELATIGYLEDIQNAAEREQIVGGATAFVPFLGVESARWWRGLSGFWAGEEPHVRAVDSTEDGSGSR